MKTQSKPSIGAAITELRDAAATAADTLESAGEEEQAKALRAAAGKVQKAMDAMRPKPDPKEAARQRDEEDDMALDERLRREA